jgi:LacI family transcriptional regulator
LRVPFDQIAAAALELLERAPTGPAPRINLVAPTLIPRKSTAAPADAGRPRSPSGN